MLRVLLSNTQKKPNINLVKLRRQVTNHVVGQYGLFVAASAVIALVF
jgi:hypothetical protein